MRHVITRRGNDDSSGYYRPWPCYDRTLDFIVRGMSVDLRRQPPFRDFTAWFYCYTSLSSRCVGRLDEQRGLTYISTSPLLRYVMPHGCRAPLMIDRCAEDERSAELLR